MDSSFIVRKIGDSFGLFQLPKVDLIGVVPDEDSLFELLQSNLHSINTEVTPSWPEVGQPYYFVNAPNPLNVSVNQGTITEDLLAEIMDYEGNGYGNVFQTREQAKKMARKLAELFEFEYE